MAQKKNNTKERIIKTAIEMYNLYGAQNVTSRHIAEKIGISNGNLDYHFRNKETLLLSIYEKMREEMSVYYQMQNNETASSFEDFHRLVLHLDHFQAKYRFFNMDVLEISRANPKVKKILKATLKLRKEEMSRFFEQFKQEGLITEITGISLERLQHTIRVLITFWLPQQEILTGYNPEKIGVMPHYIWELIIPFMTQKGKEAYRQLMQE